VLPPFKIDTIMKSIKYWRECLSDAATECGLEITSSQLDILSEAIENAHENYGMAFYTPPASDRFADMEREHAKEKKRLKLEAEKAREDFIKNICLRHNCQPYQVILEGNGEATIIK